MAGRRFELPGIQDLSKDQEDARALPKNGQHLIIGGPGTGKSILALLRARRHQRDGDKYLFLVYNHLLNRASRQLFGTELLSRTWLSWFGSLFLHLTHERLPLVQGDGNFRPIDWDAVTRMMEQTDSPGELPLRYLIIDEGQDMPPAFYAALVNVGFENFFVVADQNQQIVSGQHSNRSDIETALGIATRDVIELRDNYRNSYPTARLAREFMDPDPASPPPRLPRVTESSRKPLLFSYRSGLFPRLIERILKMADKHPRKLIGVITPNNGVRERYLNKLLSSQVTLDNSKPRITTYQTGRDADLSFDQGGIMVINAQSCKGLEFDTVFLADINAHAYRHNDPYHTRNLFYVMVARAIDNVILLQESEASCPVAPIIPNDAQILERKN